MSMEWILAKDKRPEIDETQTEFIEATEMGDPAGTDYSGWPVLVCGKFDGEDEPSIHIARYGCTKYETGEFLEDFWDFYGDCSCNIDDTTAWMPLPELYKG